MAYRKAIQIFIKAKRQQSCLLTLNIWRKGCRVLAGMREDVEEPYQLTWACWHRTSPFPSSRTLMAITWDSRSRHQLMTGNTTSLMDTLIFV